ncbi:type II toxin-antitoxin system VapC family toxin [Candidatus Woesearchaeota archaeon]|nr:type II toxin-antitoxin system VapC family toxin [Candidatus Woesearchaeota archaeon]
MEDKICLDTDFLIHFLRNKKEETEFILAYEKHLLFATTIINLFELYYGAYKSGLQKNVLEVEELRHRLTILPLSTESVKKAGAVLAMLEKQGNTIEFRDLLIGTAAQTEGFCIKTHNKKHFTKIPELIVK